jgi:tetratricopeptide (TPR) repeat protein
MNGKLGDIYEDVERVFNVVEDILEYIRKSERSATFLASDRQYMPLKPDVFHGQDDFVEHIAQFFLQEETSRVCILGPGGMGKTSVSLAVVESSLLQQRFPPHNCVWVPCIEATSAARLLEILRIQLQMPGDKQITLEKIISELDASKEPRLILLDNFETPWNSSTQEQVEVILLQLAELRHIAILVTMRETRPPCSNGIKWQSKYIEPVDDEACLRIFHEINPSSKDDPDVGRLLTALGYMPFAVTLMAKLGMEGKATAKELLDAWFESGPDILSCWPEQSMNQSIGLSVESDLVKRNPNAIVLLSTLSLLPAGTTKENLRWWAPALKMIPCAIDALSRAALLVENKQNLASSVLFVSPVVQSFMQQQDRIAEEIQNQIQPSCCQYVLDHACRYDDSMFSVKSEALAAEDTNIQSILFRSPASQNTVLSDRTMEALIAFSWHRCDTKPSLEIADYVVTAANASGERYLASAVWCLGQTYHQLGEMYHAYNHLQKAYQLFSTLPPGDVESQRLGGHCGIDLVNTAHQTLQDKGEAVSLARDVEMKCAAVSDDLIHGRALVALGNALNEARQRQEALVHLERGMAILKSLGNAVNLARAYQCIARVHYCERKVSEAVDAIQEAWKHAQSSGSQSDQMYISMGLATYLFSANRDTEAWKYLEISLMKASYIGNRLQVAYAWEHMGYGYLRRGDYQNAYGAYEAAAEKYHGTFDSRCEKNCQENMARIKQKRGDPDMVIGFCRHYFDVDESLFYPPVRASASDVPISSS